MTAELKARFEAGDRRALARAITLVESGHPAGAELLKGLRGSRRARVVGLTGSPGSGKSTLADRLIEAIRRTGETVAVLAVDPSSPFTGGAVLGDRIRMMRHYRDEGVYIRSMASRGALGGLAGATVAALSLLEAFGFDWVLVETVGVGQSEVDIARIADTTVLVLTPAAGDAVQAFKAGVMEIADVIVVNKFDLPGGPRLVEELKATLELAPPHPTGWQVPARAPCSARSSPARRARRRPPASCLRTRSRRLRLRRLHQPAGDDGEAALLQLQVEVEGALLLVLPELDEGVLPPHLLLEEGKPGGKPPGDEVEVGSGVVGVRFAQSSPRIR